MIQDVNVAIKVTLIRDVAGSYSRNCSLLHRHVLLFLRQKYINVDSIQVDLFTFFKRKENWMRIEHCDLNVGSVVYIDVKGGKCDRVLLSSSAKD